MKKTILSLCMTVLTVATTMAQLKERHVIYSVDVTADGPDMEMVTSMMADSKLEMYFKNDFTNTKMDMGIMAISTNVDAKGGDVLMLMDMMGMKVAVATTSDELEKTNQGEDKPKMELTLYPKEKARKIQGYKCKKATLTNEDGDVMTYWYTESIKINATGQNYLNKQIPGFPMEFEQTAQGMNMKFTVTTFEKKLGKDMNEVFSMKIPEGYDQMTMEELQGMGM